MRNRLIECLACRLATTGLVAVLGAGMLAQSPPNQTSSLPMPVMKAFRQAFPAATISTTTQERDSDRVVFRVDSVDKGRRRVLLYDASGTAIELAEQVEEKDLPPPVAAAMHAHPRAIYVTGMKVTRGGSVEYRLTVRGTRKTAMVAKPDGTVVSFK
jgi:hypothetical protein